MRLNIISLNRIAEYRSSIEKYSLEVEEQQEIANKMIEKNDGEHNLRKAVIFYILVILSITDLKKTVLEGKCLMIPSYQMRLRMVNSRSRMVICSSIEEVEEQQEIANKMIEKKRLRAQPKESCNLLYTCNTIYNGFVEKGSRR